MKAINVNTNQLVIAIKRISELAKLLPVYCFKNPPGRKNKALALPKMLRPELPSSTLSHAQANIAQAVTIPIAIRCVLNFFICNFPFQILICLLILQILLII